MPFEILLPSLLHQVSVPAECFWAALLEYLVPRWDLLPFGAGGPSEVALDVVPPRGMLSTGSGEGCCLLGLGDFSGTSAGGAAEAESCSAEVIRWMGGTWVPAPSKCDRKLPACLWAPLGWHVRQPDRQRGSWFGFCLPLGWLVPPVTDGFGMLPVEWLSLRGPLGLGIPDGCRTSTFGLLDGAGMGDLCFLDSWGAQGLSIHGNMGADGSGFFNGLCCLGLILMKFHTQFPDSSPPTGVYGWVSGQQLF